MLEGLEIDKSNNICLLSSFSELQYLVAEGALAPEAKDVAVNSSKMKKANILLSFSN